MVRISTRFDTFYDKELEQNVKKKVFMVRGDEAYARTTETTIELDQSTITTGAIEGLKIPSMKILLKRTLGNGVVHLFDGDDPQPIYTANTTNSTSEITITNLYLAYGVNHNLWAKYTPRGSQCLPSKSKKTTVFKELPASLKIKFTKTSGATQFNTGASVTGVFSVKVGSNNAPNTTDINVYVDDELKTTVHPTSGSLSLSLSGIADGKHTIKLEVENTASYYGGSFEYDVCVGYDLTLVSVPTVLVNGNSKDIVVSIFDYNGNPSASHSVALYNSSNQSVSSTYQTNSSGVATITISSLSSTGQYHIGGSNSVTSSPFTISVISPSLIELSVPSNVIGYGYELPITCTLSDGTNPVPYQPVTFKRNSTTIASTSTDENGIASTTYIPNRRGNVEISVESGSLDDSVWIDDVYAYFTPQHRYNLEKVKMMSGGMNVYQNYLKLSSTGSDIRIKIDDSSNKPCTVMFYVNQSSVRDISGFKIYNWQDQTHYANVSTITTGYYKLEFNRNSLTISKSTNADFTVIPSDMEWSVVSTVSLDPAPFQIVPYIQFITTSSNASLNIPKLRVL